MLIATVLEPFLIEFQSNKPLVPYLYDRLQRLMLVLMGRFVKSSILEGVKTVYDLVKLNIKKEKRT